jgi:ketosteroid isomerase-like protein
MWSRPRWTPFATGGIEALARFYHPEAEIVGGPYFGPTGTHRGGPDALRRIMSDVADEYDGFTVSPTIVRAGGVAERVLVEGIVTYVGGAWRLWWVVTVRDGKIARVEVFHEAPKALLAAGLDDG